MQGLQLYPCESQLFCRQEKGHLSFYPLWTNSSVSKSRSKRQKHLRNPGVSRGTARSTRWQRCYESGSTLDMAVFHPAAVNGTRGGTGAILWLKIQKGISSRSIWITAIAADKAGGWSPDQIKKGRPGSPNDPPENNKWIYRRS